MGLALGTAIDALAGEITAVFHSHVEVKCWRGTGRGDEEWEIAEWACV